MSSDQNQNLITSYLSPNNSALQKIPTSILNSDPNFLYSYSSSLKNYIDNNNIGLQDNQNKLLNSCVELEKITNDQISKISTRINQQNQDSLDMNSKIKILMDTQHDLLEHIKSMNSQHQAYIKAMEEILTAKIEILKNSIPKSNNDLTITSKFSTVESDIKFLKDDLSAFKKTYQNSILDTNNRINSLVTKSDLQSSLQNINSSLLLITDDIKNIKNQKQDSSKSLSISQDEKDLLQKSILNNISSQLVSDSSKLGLVTSEDLKITKDYIFKTLNENLKEFSNTLKNSETKIQEQVESFLTTKLPTILSDNKVIQTHNNLPHQTDSDAPIKRNPTMTRPSRTKKIQSNERQFSKQCGYCKKKGHFTRDCWNRPQVANHNDYIQKKKQWFLNRNIPIKDVRLLNNQNPTQFKDLNSLNPQSITQFQPIENMIKATVLDSLKNFQFGGSQSKN